LHIESAQLVEQVLQSKFCCKKLLLYFSRSGQVRSGWVRSDGINGDNINRATSDQVQLNLPTRAELGKIIMDKAYKCKIFSTMGREE
jgi:hypothetical protein